MTLDGAALARGLGAEEAPTIHRHLCRSQRGAYEAALASGEPLLVACAQEAPLFRQLAEAAGAPAPLFTDIRDRAGWSTEDGRATPKMAALIAEALEVLEPTPAVTLRSEGRVLVLGDDSTALEAARRLAAELAVTCVLTKTIADAAPPNARAFAVLSGRVTRATGHLGAFMVTVESPAGLSVSARDVLRFDPPGPDRAFPADILLDLRREPPLMGPRDGYLRADGRDAVGLERAIVEASALVGEFEKPRYIRFDASLCAHSRNLKTGCTRCLDVCPSSAIVPDGDHVRIDSAICMGHGDCVSACPTGAVAFDYPADNGIHKRLSASLNAYARSVGGGGGGQAPVLLVYAEGLGDETLSALARFGDGLPARALPFAVASVGAIGLDFLLTAASRGVSGVVVLADPAGSADLGPMREGLELTRTVMGAMGYDIALSVVASRDPDELAAALATPGGGPVATAATHLVMGAKRSTMGLALKHLNAHAPTPVEEVPLPDGAPFGAVRVDVDKCTLCLSCVGVCPTNALSGHAERPSLGFTEAACVQCGLCRVTCPERVITLEPRLDLRPESRTRQVLKEEEPHCCPRCGKAFGTKSSITLMMSKLSAHPMFQGSDRLALIGLCEDCRVVAQYEGEEERRPFRMGPPRVPRTTDDYLREREEAKRMAADAEREAAEKGGAKT